MADRKTDSANDTQQAGGDGDHEKKKKPLKLILAILLILGLEAGTIFATAIFTRKPEISRADGFKDDLAEAEERLVEVSVLHERFPNRKSGVTMLYETTLAVQVKKKNSDKVTQIIEANAARIQMAIGMIWRNAEPRHFDEPYLDTLSRQAHEILVQIIDEGLPEGEESRIEGVLIPTLTGWRSDN